MAGPRRGERSDGPVLSRRALLGGATAGAGAAAVGDLTAAGRAGAAPVTDTVDVVVVGAGLAGLVAAWRLVQAKRRVVVLEARSRVGGRMARQRVAGGGWIDLGGQWIGPTQDRIAALAGELGVRTFPWYQSGNNVLNWNGTRALTDSHFLPLPGQPQVITQADVDDAGETLAKLTAISATVPPAAPWETPGAPGLDRQTLDTWLAGTATTQYGNFFLASLARIGGSGAFEPGDTSVLHFAWTQKVAPQSEMPETSLFFGGAGQIPIILARKLGSRVVLGQPVQDIDQSTGRVTVSTPDRAYQADRVIVAMPPVLTSQIRFDPAVPAQRAQLTHRMPMGSLLKVHAIYPDAFWRSSGLSGVGMGNLPTIEFTADSSEPSGRPGILTGFIAADRAVTLGLGTPDARRQAVLADFTAYFGSQAANPVQFIEVNWPAERWTRGAFTAFMPPGVWTAYGQAVRAPIGRIFWAGTETATRWPGYFDGAVRSGESAAHAVLGS